MFSEVYGRKQFCDKTMVLTERADSTCILEVIEQPLRVEDV